MDRVRLVSIVLVGGSLACSPGSEPRVDSNAGDEVEGPTARVLDLSHVLGVSEFSAIVGVEFSDPTTLIVADRIEGITLVELDGEAHALGQRGLGPGEYRMVTAVMRDLRSKTMTFYDQRAGRYLVWRADSTSTFDPTLEATGPAPVGIRTTPLWRSGDTVFAVREPLGSESPDSATVLAMAMEGGEATPLFPVRSKPFAAVTVNSGGRSTTTFIPLSLAHRDFLAPLPSGDVAVLSADRLTLMRVRPSGEVAGEASIPVTPRSVTPDELAAARKELDELGGREAEVDWPAHHPPYTSLTTSSGGDILVGLTRGEEMTEHVWLDRELKPRSRFGLQSGHRVVAFDPPLVVTTQVDDHGIITLHLVCVLAEQANDSARVGDCEGVSETPRP